MRKTLPERIDEALAGQRVAYAELAHRLWPADSKAWRYSSNGGPPGCYMALSAGLRRGGFFVDYGQRGKSNGARLVHPRVTVPGNCEALNGGGHTTADCPGAECRRTGQCQVA